MITSESHPKLFEACHVMRRTGGLEILDEYSIPLRILPWHLVKAESELKSFTVHGLSTIVVSLSKYAASAPSLTGILQVLQRHVRSL